MYKALEMTELADKTDRSAVATVNGSAKHISKVGKVVATVDCLAIAGTSPTLDVKIQNSADGKSGWADFITFAQKTAVGRETLSKLGDATKPYYRVVDTLGGTGPSATFDVSMEGINY